MTEEINLEKLLSEANDVHKHLNVAIKEPPSEKLRLPLSSKETREVLEKIVSSYVGHKISKDLVEQVKSHVSSHLLKEQRLVGADVKFKFNVDSHGLIKKITFDIQGHPVYDPYVPVMLESAAECNRKLIAVVDKEKDIVNYSWKAGSDDLLHRPKEACYGGNWVRTTLRTTDKKQQNVRFKRLRKVWAWLKSICPIIVTVKWREKIHPHFNMPMSHFRQLVDIWQVASGALTEEQLLEEQKKRRRKFWTPWFR